MEGGGLGRGDETTSCLALSQSTTDGAESRGPGSDVSEEEEETTVVAAAAALAVAVAVAVAVGFFGQNQHRNLGKK
ncbi:hypothetical protein NL676_033627 [Syzygium grande]|nr:hypothetical protein NL676_033627 [Syzygium grande]